MKAITEVYPPNDDVLNPKTPNAASPQANSQDYASAGSSPLATNAVDQSIMDFDKSTGGLLSPPNDNQDEFKSLENLLPNKAVTESSENDKGSAFDQAFRAGDNTGEYQLRDQEEDKGQHLSTKLFNNDQEDPREFGLRGKGGEMHEIEQIVAMTKDTSSRTTKYWVE